MDNLQSTNTAVTEETYQRWYDKSPVLNQSVSTLTRFPQGIQSLIASEMNTMAEERYDIKYNLKSLGKDKVLALHKAQNKRREYDSDPDVFKTFSYWYVLPEQERYHFASQIMGTSSAVYRFLKVSSEYRHSFEEQDLQFIIHSWIWEGEEKTAALIDQYQDKLRTQRIELEVSQELKLQDQKSGMFLDPETAQSRLKKTEQI